MATNRTLPEGAADGFRAELKQQESQTERACELLRHATETLEVGKPGEPAADRAQRLRGVAALLHTAALEVAVTCGWLEATDAAEQQGILEPGQVRS